MCNQHRSSHSQCDKVKKVRVVIEAEYHEDQCENYTNWREDLDNAIAEATSVNDIQRQLKDLAGSYQQCGCSCRSTTKKFGFQNVRVLPSAQEV